MSQHAKPVAHMPGLDDFTVFPMNDVCAEDYRRFSGWRDRYTGHWSVECRLEDPAEGAEITLDGDVIKIYTTTRVSGLYAVEECFMAFEADIIRERRP